MNRTPRDMSEAIAKFLYMKKSHSLNMRRAYDDWTIKQLWQDRKRKRQIINQRLSLVEHQQLGSDLATARFVIRFANGRVRSNHDKWISTFKELPPDYSKSFKITAIQLIKSDLVNESVDNFVGLDHLEWLDLSENKNLDDYACDMLGRQFRTSSRLKEVHLNYNPSITLNGINVLFRIPSIQRIFAIDTRASIHSDADAFVMAAEDEKKDVYLYENDRKFRSDDLEELRLDNKAKQTNY